MKIFKFHSPFGSGCTLYFAQEPNQQQVLDILMKKYNESIGNSELSDAYGTAYDAVKRSNETEYPFKRFFEILDVIGESEIFEAAEYCNARI